MGSELVYKLIFRKPVQKTGHQLEFFVEGCTYNIPMYAWEHKQQKTRREGTLITMRGAAEGAVGYIPASQFDKAMESLQLQLIVPTKMQRIKDTQVFNGNRFCVVETPEDLKRIPSQISLKNPLSNIVYSVRLSFKGQEIFCSRCNESHVGQCPALQAFYTAKKQKEVMINNDEILSKIYSDSTLRNVDTLGLTADVCAMSGGGLGQIIQASLDDPGNIQQERIIIMGGTNDIKQQNFPSTDQFAANIDLSLKKLSDSAGQAPGKTFYLVQQRPADDREDGEVALFDTTDQCIRQSYMHGCMRQLCDTVANIECVNVEYDVDGTGHPTDAGTMQILTTLNNKEVTPAPLIWNDNFIYSSKPYKQVESIYRYGCNGCNRYGTGLTRDKYNHQLLCDLCFEDVVLTAQQPNQRLQDITERINHLQRQHEEHAFPLPKRRKADESTTTSPPPTTTDADGDDVMNADQHTKK